MRTPEQNLWGAVLTLAVSDAMGIFSLPTDDEGTKGLSGHDLIISQYNQVVKELLGLEKPSFCIGTEMYRNMCIHDLSDVLRCNPKNIEVSQARYFLKSPHFKQIVGYIGYGTEFCRRSNELVELCIDLQNQIFTDFKGKKIFPNCVKTQTSKLDKNGSIRTRESFIWMGSSSKVA